MKHRCSYLYTVIALTVFFTSSSVRADNLKDMTMIRCSKNDLSACQDSAALLRGHPGTFVSKCSQGSLQDCQKLSDLYKIGLGTPQVEKARMNQLGDFCVQGDIPACMTYSSNSVLNYLKVGVIKLDAAACAQGNLAGCENVRGSLNMTRLDRLQRYRRYGSEGVESQWSQDGRQNIKGDKNIQIEVPGEGNTIRIEK